MLTITSTISGTPEGNFGKLESKRHTILWMTKCEHSNNQTDFLRRCGSQQTAISRGFHVRTLVSKACSRNLVKPQNRKLPQLKLILIILPRRTAGIVSSQRSSNRDSTTWVSRIPRRRPGPHQRTLVPRNPSAISRLCWRPQYPQGST